MDNNCRGYIASPLLGTAQGLSVNEHYADFAILRENFFNGPNHTVDPTGVTNEQFLGIGAPHGV